jgi:transcriptional regulator with XRE-family HTH domain
MKNRNIAERVSKKQKATIETLAKKGCTLSEVGTALGLSQSQLSQILEEESHPFNVAYWHAKVAYTQRLRDFALDIAEHCEDASVRGKIVEYLVTENSKAFENKRLHTGYTNIKKLLSLVRQQFVDGNGNRTIMKSTVAVRHRRLKQCKEVSPE